MKTIKMLALALVLIGATKAANAATTFLSTDDFVGISFWLISMGMLAATAFFFMEQANVSTQWRKSVNVAGLVTGVAFINYMYMRGVWVETGDTPTVYRYIDWLITVPLQLVEFYLILSAVRKVDSSIFWRLLIGSLVTTELFNNYKYYKMDGILDEKPVVSVVLEEAPRVLGKEALECGSNIFSTIAREGRKFKVGLTAITQLPSLIPREILANINTKIILGIEMKPERTAVIESASQDLSEDDRTIASLDIGEALISSNFSKFAIPVKIPIFEDVVKNSSKKEDIKSDFSGVKLS